MTQMYKLQKAQNVGSVSQALLHVFCGVLPHTAESQLAGTSVTKHLCDRCAEADKAVAEAGFRAFRSALSVSGSEQPIAEPLADSASTHGKMLAAPAALQGKKLRLGKKVTK